MKKILIVDDCLMTQRLCTALLASPEYELSSVSSGSEALLSCARAKPDLILLDLCLPEMDGLEVTRLLKANLLTRDIPIVAVTAYGQGEATDEALSAGVDSFLAKPFSGVALRETVARFVRARRAQGELQSIAPRSAHR